jgi:mRNA interferase RelE/StbE
MYSYKVLLRTSAQKVLKKLELKTKTRIAEKIHRLGHNPDDPGLDIKPLKGPEKLFRLRIGDWRVIYARDDIVRIISIEKIGSRGDVYKH